MPANGRPIVILGLPRSGTSAVTGALNRLGIFLGNEDELLPADENNPHGYYEDKALAAFNAKCFGYFQMHPLSLRELPEAWPAYPQGQMLIGELRKLLARFQGRPAWGFKQPLAALLWPIYSRALGELGLEPQIVLCVRHPVEAHASGHALRYRTGEPQLAPIGNVSGGVWLNFTLGALEAADDSPLTVVPFSRFVKEPHPFLSEILEKQGNLNPSEFEWAAALATIRPEGRHTIEDDSSFEALPSIIGETYRLCESGAKDKARAAALIGEFRAWREMLAPPKLSGTQMGLAWKVRGDTESVVEPFLPSGDWQTVSLRIPAPPRTELHGVLYNKPCRIWIKRCVFRMGKDTSEAVLRPGPGSNLASVQGVMRLEGAYEPRQIILETPTWPGPYTLELELLLESGLPIVNDSVARTAGRLSECMARHASLRRGERP